MASTSEKFVTIAVTAFAFLASYTLGLFFVPQQVLGDFKIAMGIVGFCLLILAVLYWHSTDS